MAQLKKSLRTHFLTVRKKESAVDKAKRDGDLTQFLTTYLLQLQTQLPANPIVAIYMAFKSEADVGACADPLREAGWRVVVPITDRTTKQLKFAEVTKDTVWREGALGISEPDLSSFDAGDGGEKDPEGDGRDQDPEGNGRGNDSLGRSPYVDATTVSVFCVPGLAFTRDGLRLGYGGGYYDRLFARPGVDGRRIGILHECQLTDTLPGEDHDIRMHFLATEAGVRSVL